MKSIRLDDLPDLLTVNEATAYLRVSRNTVYDAIRMRIVPSIKMGRRVLIPKEGLRRMVEECVCVAVGDATQPKGNNQSPKLVLRAVHHDREK